MSMKIRHSIVQALVWVAVGGLALGVARTGPARAAVEPVQLRCEYLQNPVGVGTTQPRLSWRIEDGSQRSEVGDQKSEESIQESVFRSQKSEDRVVRQTAYQVLVASSETLLAQDKGDLWDSGKVESDQSNQIEYAGNPLTSRIACFWKVRIWTTSDLNPEPRAQKPTPWSAPASWTMGLLDAVEFKAKWIGVEQRPRTEAVPLLAGALRIVKATYQTVSGDRGADVTELVAKAAVGNMLLFKADNAMLGDPAPGSPKQLVVDYELAGERGQKTVSENGQLAINCNVQDEYEARYARPRYLRKAFTLDRAVRRALLFATALGVYEARLNGGRVGDQELAPEWTDYSKRVQVQAYDVTGLVRRGENALGAVVGNGWYSGGWQHWGGGIKAIYGAEPFFFAQLEIEYTDGSRATVVTDETWRGTTEGPLQFAGIYEGVTYDARAELRGWDRPRFDEAAWTAVKPPPDGTKIGKLDWKRNEPIRVTRELKPVALTEPKPGVYVFDLGQNMVGRTRVAFRGRPGETVELQHAEICNPDGTVFTGNLWVITQHRMQLDRYTFHGDGVEVFEPPFTYHGFRYVEVRGLKEKPALDSLTGVVFHSDCPEVGSFSCSEPLLNRLAQNVLWSQRSNYMGVPTDCPQRNERCGYTGDAQFFMRAAVYNMDVAAFFSKWLMDVQDAQQPDGHFTDHAPTYGPGDGINVGWMDAGIICTYEIYRTYGDTRILREHYAAMKRFLDFLNRNSRDHLYTGRIGNGDWLSTGGGAAPEVIGTAYMAFNFKLMAEMAEALGEKEDAAAFRAQFDRIAAAFAKAYIDAEGRIKDSSQTGYALAFTMGLVPAGMEEKMAARFAEEVARHGGHPRTGFIGTPRLLPGLHLAGRDAEAYRMMLKKTAPSWLYPVTVNATTIWEQWVAWDGVHPQGGMQSHNHYAFGAVLEYLFGMVGGIQPAAPGYKAIRIQPVIRDGLTWADTSYDSIHGRIVSRWKIENGALTLEVVIPPNTTAEVHVPVKDRKEVTESGMATDKAPGVKFLRMEIGAAVYEVGSGKYAFVRKPVSGDPGAAGPEGYTWCAKEGDSMAWDGPHDVAFGANGNFAYAFNQTGAITFTPAAFGQDPAPGVVKAGYSRRSGPPADPLGVLRKPIPDKLVVLTFDDGCSTHATYVAPLLKSHGFGGSFYLCTLPSFNNKDWYMTWEQMKEMVKDGFEIGNHTRDHTVGAGIGPFLDMENEMVKNGLPKPTTQAWPCYAPNTKTFADLSSHGYTFARGGHFRPYRPTVDHPLDIPSFSPKDMKQFAHGVKQAAHGNVVVITYHGVPDYEHGFAGTDPVIFKEMMQYLKDHDYKVIALRDLAEYVDPVNAAKLPTTK